MIKHIEVKTYENWGISVMVKIDYDNKQISLVEKRRVCSSDQSSFIDKKWVFAGRGLEYMKGWENIILAMDYAMKESAKELKQYLVEKEKEKSDEVTAVLLEATSIVKKRGQK